MLEKNKTKKILYIISITLFFILAFVFYNNASDIFATSITELQEQQKDILEQQSENAKQYSSVKADIEVYENEIKELEAKANEYSTQIESLQAKIVEYTASAESYNKELQEVSLNYENTRDLLLTRLRALYEKDFVNFWEVLFSSSNVLDFLSKYSVIIELIEYDTTKLKAMQNQKEYVNRLKQVAEIKKTQVLQAEFDLETSKASLEKIKSNKESKLATLENSKAELETISKELDALYQKSQQDLEDALRAIAAQNTGTFSGIFGWPIQYGSWLTTSFNEWYCPFGTWYQHTNGVDLARSSCEIYSIADGVVAGTGYDGSAGYYVNINHGTSAADGATYISSYYHLKANSICVSKGDVVVKGQKIAMMGTTGSSTGVHLHFRLRRNGKDVDPLLYVSYKVIDGVYYGT